MIVYCRWHAKCIAYSREMEYKLQTLHLPFSVQNSWSSMYVSFKLDLLAYTWHIKKNALVISFLSHLLVRRIQLMFKYFVLPRQNGTYIWNKMALQTDVWKVVTMQRSTFKRKPLISLYIVGFFFCMSGELTNL